MDRAALGRAAEQQGAEFLQQQGLTILLRNFRCRLGELDLVALAADGTLVIAEVRLRTQTRNGDAAASVDIHKQHRLTLAARLLLARYPTLARRALRFDVLAVDAGGAVRWIQQAFEAR